MRDGGNGKNEEDCREYEQVEQRVKQIQKEGIGQ